MRIMSGVVNTPSFIPFELVKGSGGLSNLCLFGERPDAMDDPFCTSVLLEVVLPISLFCLPSEGLSCGFFSLVEAGAGSCMRL